MLIESAGGFQHLHLGNTAYSSSKAQRLKSALEIESLKIHSCNFHTIDANSDVLDESDLIETLLSYGKPDESTPRLHRLFANYLNLNCVENHVDSLESISDSTTASIALLPPNSFAFFITPTPHTQSPWSSKATEIFNVCGLGKSVARVECGIFVVIDVSVGTQLSVERKATIAEHFYDKMTQSIFIDEIPYSFRVGRQSATAVADSDPLISLLPPPVWTALQTAPQSTSSFSVLQEIEIVARTAFEKFTGGKENGFHLSTEELFYLTSHYLSPPLLRDPTLAEVTMFAQVNSEHCRHKIFNATWSLDGKLCDDSLFAMIRSTFTNSPSFILSAYSDNAAVLAGHQDAIRFAPNTVTHDYESSREAVHIVCKVETHNHPTAISPFPGAATGSGGEIRDEGAVGRGSRPKCGMVGFVVSNLCIPHHERSWESAWGEGSSAPADRLVSPPHIASPLEIMLQAPLGSSSYNNEFGRPCLAGFMRTLLTTRPSPSNEDAAGVESQQTRRWHGYHKPIMIAGGIGTIRHHHVLKRPIPPDSPLVVLGGPSMLIGMGGSVASSVTAGASTTQLDLASVQRDNPEMERRCQQVIDACCGLGEETPIVSIHDVGAGGLSNALPELVRDCLRGAVISLAAVPTADASLTDTQIWCNESQERYVLAIDRLLLPLFQSLCERERCPMAVVGHVTLEQRLKVISRLNVDKLAVDLPMDFLFSSAAKLSLSDTRPNPPPWINPRSVPPASAFEGKKFHEDCVGMLCNVLRLPSVASKSYLITIGDRSISGLVVREPMVGPWQVPVADVAVTLTSFPTYDEIDGSSADYEFRYTGEAMAVGERCPVAIASPVASGRLAVAEAILNLAASSVTGGNIQQIRLSANWMSSARDQHEGVALYETVEAVASMCRSLNVTIPVGKDSLSMKTKWTHRPSPSAAAHFEEVQSPLSLVVTAFAPVDDVRRTLTPLLKNVADSVLVLVDLGLGRMRMGGSALHQTHLIPLSQYAPPDVENALLLTCVVSALHQASSENLILAYHDRSDGGMMTTMLEMSFSSHLGLDINVTSLVSSKRSSGVERGNHWTSILFNEELGFILQLERNSINRWIDVLEECGWVDAASDVHVVAKVLCDGGDNSDFISISCDAESAPLLLSRAQLHATWSETSFLMQKMRDNPECAVQEYESIVKSLASPLKPHTTFDPSFNPLLTTTMPTPPRWQRPKVAILREQGINGFMEMAASFCMAGFLPVDVHMTDVLAGKVSLNEFKGLAACGGFSFGDVLGAGVGWSSSILHNHRASVEFSRFFARTDTFALGICNGCQMMSRLCNFFPESSGAVHWPQFVRNQSDQFESRLCTVRIEPSPAATVWFDDMVGSRLVVPVAHGEGRTDFSGAQIPSDDSLVALRFVEGDEEHGTIRYPCNPNGSVGGATGFTSNDGRFLIMMPHPERFILSVTNTHQPAESRHWQHFGPWMRMFRNVRRWVG